MELELQLYKPTKIFTISRLTTFIIITIMVGSIPFLGFLGDFAEAYARWISIAAGVTTLIALVSKKYYFVGSANCDETSISVRLSNGEEYHLEIANILNAKINAVSYRGISAGATGLVGSGKENLMRINYPGLQLRFYYFIGDINERSKLRKFFEKWAVLNNNIFVAY